MSSELSLTWDEHRSTLVGVFERLLESSTLVDCTIAAEGQYLKAHKIILSACSPYFEMLFSQESEKNPIVVLKDIKFQELKALIDFIYRGKVKVPEERLGNFVDAAESLQIKGLGGGNQRRNNADLVETEYSLVDHNEEDLVSPRPRKRSRRSYANNNGDNVRGISPVIDLNAETKTDKELQSRETQLDVPISSEVEACTSLANLTEASTSFPSSECSEQQNLESKESISHVEEPTLQESEQVPNIENIVVKSEPEAIAEVFLPEIDCFIEPKGENIQDTMLDSAMRETEVVTGDNQPVSSQYSGFPSTLPSSSAPATVTTAGATVAGRSDNLLLMGDVGGSFTNPGADWRTSNGSADAVPSRRSVAVGCAMEGDSEAVHQRITVFIPEAPEDSLPPQQMDCASNSAVTPVDPLLLTPVDVKQFFVKSDTPKNITQSKPSRIDYPRVSAASQSNANTKKKMNRSSKNVFILPRPKLSAVGANQQTELMKTNKCGTNFSNMPVSLANVSTSVIVTQTSSLACTNAFNKQASTFHSIDNSNTSNGIEPPDSNIFGVTKSGVFRETVKSNWDGLLKWKIEGLTNTSKKSEHDDSSFSNCNEISTSSNSDSLDPTKSQPTLSPRDNNTTERLLKVLSSDYAEDVPKVEDSRSDSRRLRSSRGDTKQCPQKRTVTNFSCDYCGMRFLTAAQLQRHVEIHSKFRPIRPKTLAQVVIAPRSKNSKIFTCEKCGAKFFYSMLLSRHISTMHSSSPTTA